jgi:hypothetical protein
VTVVALLLLSTVALGLVSVFRYRKAVQRRAEAKCLAAELIPEIRAAMSACDPRSESQDESVSTSRFGLVRQRLPLVLGAEDLFAVETFYQCVEAYLASARTMSEAFGEGSELGLGDKIRAKDRRDRCLKDLYYAGEGALERLMKL